MGQAGGLDAYWAAFGDERGLQGGFVWEWADHGLRRHDEDGTAWLAYGGDFGEARHSGSFVCDGLVSPDRVPHPLLAELAALTAPVVVERVSAGRLRITNRRWFRDLEDLAASWSLEVDGRSVDFGDLDLPSIPAQGTALVADPTKRSPRVPPGEAYLRVTFRPRRRPAWAPPGWTVASCQVPVTRARVKTPARRAAATSGSASVAESGLTVGAVEIGWPELSLWRAPTDNDDPPGDWRSGLTTAGRWRELGLDQPRTVDDPPAVRRGRQWTRTVTLLGPAGTAIAHHRQTVRPDGPGLRIDERITIDGELDLPRVGLALYAPGHRARGRVVRARSRRQLPGPARGESDRTIHRAGR